MVTDSLMEMDSSDEGLDSEEKKSKKLSGVTPESVVQEASRIGEGARFKDMQELKFALRCWGVWKQRTYSWQKCRKTYRVAVCRYGRKPKPHSNRARNLLHQNKPTPKNGFAGVEARRECMTEEALANPCEWRVRAKVAQDSSVVITVCKLVHTCPAHVHSWRASATAEWLAQILGNRVVNNPTITVNQLQDAFKNEYGRQATYKALWRSREVILDHMMASESTTFLNQCISGLKDPDGRALVEADTGEEPPRKRSRLCSHCRENGHDRRNCPSRRAVTSLRLTLTDEESPSLEVPEKTEVGLYVRAPSYHEGSSDVVAVVPSNSEAQLKPETINTCVS
ncbi:hypothetical protein R1sor_023035 [Riccia sorocarpa]|uniref:CCHC-type domain-containing protein n=1 Tax=Riccia sorocarpa TaxID=122646 RepID=A0ABD3GQQ4_9MARC